MYTSERFGCKIPVETPTHFAVIADLKNGMLANMNFSFDISKSTMPHMEIYGTDGTLEAPDPNMTGGVPKVYRREQMLALADRIKMTEAFAHFPNYIRMWAISYEEQVW